MSFSLDAPKKRHAGVELFRCFSMVLICILHILGKGGVLAYSADVRGTYYTAWLLETLGYCSVNCYALISGYVNKDEEFRLSKLVKMWLEVVFWLVVPCVIFSLTGKADVTAEDWKTALMPVTNKAYWYFNAYVLLSPFIPLLNRGLKSLSKKQYIGILAFLFVATTCLHPIAGYDTFVTSYGYSAMWLIVMYVFGAYFRIHGFPSFAKWYVTVPLFAVCWTSAWILKIHSFDLVSADLISKDSIYYEQLSEFLQYTSPFIVIMSLCALCFFAQIDIKNKVVSSVIGVFGKHSFGVYLIHVGPLVWANIMSLRYKYIADFSPARLAFEVIGTAILMFICLDILSILRSLLFRVCGIDRGINALAGLLNPKKKDETEESIIKE